MQQHASPSKRDWRQLQAAGCRGCWWDGSGQAQPHGHQLQKPDTIPLSPAQNDVKSKEEMTIFCGL